MGRKHKYGVILDAGSSGTRVYVYEYKRADYVRAEGDAEETRRLPKIKTKKKWNTKIHPGISTFGEKPELVGQDHLKELVKFAEDIVPKDEIENTPIFLLATAGMRLLPKNQQTQLLGNVCSYLKQNAKFQIPDCDLHVQVIPGETEGLYGWVAANYLLGGFDAPESHDHGKNHHTYGFLDMGGASAQIAFAPNATEAEKHANDLKLLRLRKVNGEPLDYRVFTTTWLGFGADEARRRYVEHLLDAYPKEHDVPDPCLPVGARLNKAGGEIVGDTSSKDPILVGTGDFAECLASTYPLLEKTKPCADPPCLLNGVHTPGIDFDVNHFVGVSNYWHATHEIFAMAHKDKAYDFHTYQKQVKDFCSRDWTEILDDVKHEKWGHKVDEEAVEEVCFKASWVINMLHDGIGIPRVGLEHVKEPGGGHDNKTNKMLDKGEERGFLDPFQAVDKIDDTEVSWTLGKMVLYASSQMPAAQGALPVGFGSNIPDVKLPADFQYASGQVEPSEHGTIEAEDWQDRILHSGYARRIPGILIFLIILALVVYLVCGREKRTTLWQKITGRSSRYSPAKPPKRRKAGRLGGKLFGSNEPSYERVLEDAEVDPSDFELEDHYSDSSTGSADVAPRTGRTSGMATPLASARSLSPDIHRYSPKKSYFDNGSVSSASSTASTNGLGITPFDRGGLIVRTDSRERLAPTPSTLGRSRTGSPRRSPLITPLNSFKENVD